MQPAIPMNKNYRFETSGRPSCPPTIPVGPAADSAHQINVRVGGQVSVKATQTLYALASQFSEGFTDPRARVRPDTSLSFSSSPLSHAALELSANQLFGVIHFR